MKPRLCQEKYLGTCRGKTSVCITEVCHPEKIARGLKYILKIRKNIPSMEADKASMQAFKSKRVVVLKTHRQCEEVYSTSKKKNKVQERNEKT
mgnify:CR=1 FL=1